MIYVLDSKGFWQCEHGTIGTIGAHCQRCEEEEEIKLCPFCKKEVIDKNFDAHVNCTVNYIVRK